MAWMATSSRCRLAACITLRRPSLVMFGAPVPPRGVPEQHHAVRVFSDPSEMIFSGPMVQRAAAGHRPAGRHPGGEEVVERVDVRPDADAQQLGPAPRGRASPGRPGRTRGRQAGHALRRGLLHRVQVGVRRGAVGADDLRQPRVDLEPLGLADHVVALRQSQAAQGRGVDPGVVTVAADQHHRSYAGHLVELAHGRLAVP